jgi:hypothetical protein
MSFNSNKIEMKTKHFIDDLGRDSILKDSKDFRLINDAQDSCDKSTDSRIPKL